MNKRIEKPLEGLNNKNNDERFILQFAITCLLPNSCVAYLRRNEEGRYIESLKKHLRCLFAVDKRVQRRLGQQHLFMYCKDG